MAIAQTKNSCDGDISSCFFQLQSQGENGYAFGWVGIGTEQKNKFDERFFDKLNTFGFNLLDGSLCKHGKKIETVEGYPGL